MKLSASSTPQKKATVRSRCEGSAAVGTDPPRRAGS
jgi:hypothetical protein